MALLKAVRRERPERRGQAVRATLLLGLLTIASPIVHGQAPARVDEYRVKAAILYNLAKFVEWPGAAFTDSASPLVVCVLGTDPFGAVLDNTLHNHLIGGRPITARRVIDVEPACHVLFVAGSERKRLAVIIDRVGTSSVLTVGEADDFTSRGGIIGLATDGERVRFDINSDAADRARLKVSARLLALATSVRRGGVTR